MKRAVSAVVACLAVIGSGAARADADPTTTTADRSQYTLFQPVPDDQLRDFNPDRPSVTTGPYTVDAGHLQVESGLIQYTKDASVGRGGDGGDRLAVVATEFRVGVLDRAEVDLTVTPFLYQRAPGTAHADGFGDLQLQAKLNLFGDDGGPVAFGLVPYLTLPTADRSLGTGHVAGGVAMPVQVSLPADFTVAGMAQFDFPRNDANTTTGFDLLHTVVLSHPLVDKLTGFAEYVGVAPARLGHGYQASVNTGLTFTAAENMQLDCAVDLGRSRATPAYSVMAGITVRG